MKNILKWIVKLILRPLNLKIIKADKRYRSEEDVVRLAQRYAATETLFDKIKTVINKDSPVCLDVGANIGQTIRSL